MIVAWIVSWQLHGGCVVAVTCWVCRASGVVGVSCAVVVAYHILFIFFLLIDLVHLCEDFYTTFKDYKAQSQFPNRLATLNRPRLLWKLNRFEFTSELTSDYSGKNGAYR